MTGIYKSAPVIAILVVSACASNSPRYETVWEPFRATEYPVSAAESICKSEGKRVYEKELASRNSSNQDSSLTGGQQDLLDGFGRSLSGGVDGAAFDACMAKLGFHQIQKCYRNCQS